MILQKIRLVVQVREEKEARAQQGGQETEGAVVHHEQGEVQGEEQGEV